MSATITLTGEDLPELMKGRIKQWMDHRCEAGMVALEKGYHMQNKHFQGIFRVRSTGETAAGISRSLNLELGKALGWYGDQRPKNAKIRIVSLSQSELHTFPGMLGTYLLTCKPIAFRETLVSILIKMLGEMKLPWTRHIITASHPSSPPCQDPSIDVLWCRIALRVPEICSYNCFCFT